VWIGHWYTSISLHNPTLPVQEQLFSATEDITEDVTVLKPEHEKVVVELGK
jgi:hypothetical protein